MLRETTDKNIYKVDKLLPGTPLSTFANKPIAQLPNNAAFPRIERYAYRSFDRQWVLADNRLGDRMRPDIWAVHSERQIYLASLLTEQIGKGPSVTASALVPDLHYFSGRGAKDIIPLYSDTNGQCPNILPSLLKMLENTYEFQVLAEAFAAYIYGVLAHPQFTEQFSDELATCGLRVPLTKDPILFVKTANVGAKLLWLHTFCERYIPDGKCAGQVPQGVARYEKAVPQTEYPDEFRYDGATETLFVGVGEFRPVKQEVFEFEVSGLKVVQSWLGYWMRNPKGKKSSPLNDITTATLGYWPSEFSDELLELLWILEATLAEYPSMAELLNEIMSNPCFNANDLPEVPDAAREKPKRSSNEAPFENWREG